MTHRDIAAAKLNLALHVRGGLPDGRHTIETLFAFCTDGDRLTADPSDGLFLTVSGPVAGELLGVEDNLVLRAARELQAESGCEKGAAIQLDKQLPVASGIGGVRTRAGIALPFTSGLPFTATSAT